MANRLLFLVNVTAGKGRIKAKLADVVDLFVRHGYDVTIYTTQSRDDARRVAAQRAGEFDLIICSGGDGTLSEVVNGLMAHPGAKPAIGYLPMGTTNDFARSLKIPTSDILQAAKLAATGQASPLDVGSFNGKYFTYSAAFGAFSDVPYITPQKSKNILGHGAYILQGVERLPSLKSYRCTIRYDDQTITDDFLFGMVTNSESIGGFRGLCGMDVDLSDGKFEVMLIRKVASIVELNNVLMALLTHNPSIDGIYAFRASKLEIECEEPLAWTLDGEYGGAPRTSRLEVKRKAIRYVTGLTFRTGNTAKPKAKLIVKLADHHMGSKA